MSRIAKRPCPICSYPRIETLYNKRFVLPEGHPLGDGYDVVCCNACGFVYADTAVSQAAYDQFYAQLSKYEDQKTGTGGGDNPLDCARLWDTAVQIADFLKNPDLRVLDVGCANGGLLQALREMGYTNLSGIDPSPACAQNTQKLGFTAYQGSFGQPISHGPYDCLILSHVLEHVQDIKQAMGWIRQNLSETGWVYVEVPNANGYTEYLYSPFQDFNTEHINHFSPPHLEKLMERYGFEFRMSGEKRLEVSPGMFYPATYGFWKLDEQPESDPAILRDEELSWNILEYIEQSQLILDQIDERLKKAIAEKDKIIVWGAGQLTLTLLAETYLGLANIVAFVDSNPINQGRTIQSTPVYDPQHLHTMPYPIVISSILHSQEIADHARAMGLANELILLFE